ncbi:MAG: c-type cytochrome [Armatimonadetes bacterium]|nr:c-type cytochrome [Armatimonadota bacterium]
MRVLTTILAMCVVSLGFAQSPAQAHAKDVFSTSSCTGCHGQTAMGGLGPPLAQTKVEEKEFMDIVRKGKGMMPAIKQDDISDADLPLLYAEVKAKPWVPEEIPVAYKVGQFLSPKSVSRIFMFAFGLAFVMAMVSLGKWLRAAGLPRLMPSLAKLGWGKVAGITIKSLFLDGFLVQSLYKHDKRRWLMHGLMLYGFCGLIIADILIAVNNPQRSQLPLTDPLKMLPLLSGVAVFIGVSYVMYRYKKDEYIDNGLTLGRDFAFVNFLVHVAFSGFLVVLLKRAGAHDWVMTVYLYHLAAVLLLIVTAPFTRFQHAYVAPALAAMTRLTDAVIAAGVDIGFEREPSPGRHHKSVAIAESVLSQLGPEYEGSVTIRYYP